MEDNGTFTRDDNGGTAMSHDPFQEREAEKYTNPIPSREFILEHLTKREKPAGYALVGRRKISALAMSCVTWNRWRWLTVAVSFAILLPPAALSGRFLRLCKVSSRSWITTRWPIWLKRINRFINYCWWNEENFHRS